MNYSPHSIIEHPRIYFLLGFLAFCGGIITEIRNEVFLSWGILLVFLFFMYGKSLQIYLICGICFLGGMWMMGNHTERKLHALTTIESLTHGFSGTHEIIWVLDRFLYFTDTQAVFRLKIDTFANQSTSSSWVRLSPPIGIQFSSPRNLHTSVWDQIYIQWVLQPIHTSSGCVWPLWLCDFSRYTWMHDVFGKITPRTWNILASWTPSIREHIQEWAKSIFLRGFPRETAGILMGISIGNTDIFRSDTKETFKASGLMHILVVSGSNIAFVMLCIWWILRYFPLHRWGEISIILTSVLLYGSLVGWDIPVIRATIMGSIAYIWIRHGMRLRAISILVAVAWWYLLYKPDALIFDASFWLSFCATLGIITLYPSLEHRGKHMHIPKTILPLIGVTLAATLWSIPPWIYHFWSIIPFGIVSNILVGGILGILLILTTLYLICALFAPPIILYSIGFLIYPLAAYIQKTAQIFSSYPSLSIDIWFQIPLTLFGVLCIYFFGIHQECVHLQEVLNPTNPAVKKDHQQ